MVDLQSLVDKIHYENRREYSHTEGNLTYLDTTPLNRPLSMPRSQRTIAIAIVAIAAALGLIFINSTVLANMRETANSEKAVAENLTHEASIESLPQMASVINMGNDDIRATFDDAGYTMFDASTESEPDTLSLYKLPADVSAVDAAVMLSGGIDKLSAGQATKLLVGGWSLTVSRGDVTSMVVRYADFSTGDPNQAVENALSKEGIVLDDIKESGVDDHGNTFSSGTLDAEGTSCNFRVSAVPLGDMYSIAGLPEDACYVGIRYTVA